MAKWDTVDHYIVILLKVKGKVVSVFN